MLDFKNYYYIYNVAILELIKTNQNQSLYTHLHTHIYFYCNLSIIVNHPMNE